MYNEVKSWIANQGIQNIASSITLSPNIILMPRPWTGTGKIYLAETDFGLWVMITPLEGLDGGNRWSNLGSPHLPVLFHHLITIMREVELCLRGSSSS